MLACLSPPDMRTPIAHCLAWPERSPVAVRQLQQDAIGTLSFEPPDPARIPALRLARAALEQDGGAPNILSAANEMAVSAFLAKRIGFLEIARIVEETLARAPLSAAPATIEDAIMLDAEGRRIADGLIEATAARRRKTIP
jgi:1-deoxy-D-xylulose-5-phosphate reductoisomerase